MRMIHFDFTVDPIDAENILDCVYTEACRCNEQALEEDKPEVKKAYRAHAEYLKELMTKMKNKEVEP